MRVSALKPATLYLIINLFNCLVVRRTLKGLREMKLQTDKQTNKWHDKVLKWQKHTHLFFIQKHKAYYDNVDIPPYRTIFEETGHLEGTQTMITFHANSREMWCFSSDSMWHVNQSSRCEPFKTTAICSCCCFLPPPSLAIVVSQATSFHDLNRSLQSDLEAIGLIYLAAADSRCPAVAKPQVRRQKNI